MAEEDEAMVGAPRKLPHWCVWFVLGLLIVVEEVISCLINDIWFCFFVFIAEYSHHTRFSQLDLVTKIDLLLK